MKSDITAKTKLLAVIGNPIGHSLSPKIHNYFIEKTGADYCYLAFKIEENELDTFLKSVKLLNIAGVNVTMPLKEKCAELVDINSENLPSVNTVVLKGGKTHGYSTDGSGLIQSLCNNSFDPKNKRTLILGAGGAAKSVARALTEHGAEVKICARNKKRAENILSGRDIYSFENLNAIIKETDILINATPLGMKGFEDFKNFTFLDNMQKNGLIYDLIYEPLETALLKNAKERNLNAMNGIYHLVHQAALSFKLFTGMEIENEITDYLCKNLK